jgi:isopentenyl-diphosphate delta-isomerase
MTDSTEIITIVDKNDNVIDAKERGTELLSDIYRVATLWIYNSRDEILLAKRALTKKHNPGQWGPAVAGTVAYNDSYDDTIKREAMEELGVIGINFEKSVKIFSQSHYHHFTQFYKVIIDYNLDDFIVQADEVDQVKWFSLSELRKLVQEKPELFIDSMSEIIKIFS